MKPHEIENLLSYFGEDSWLFIADSNFYEKVESVETYPYVSINRPVKIKTFSGKSYIISVRDFLTIRNHFSPYSWDCIETPEGSALIFFSLKGLFDFICCE